MQQAMGRTNPTSDTERPYTRAVRDLRAILPAVDEAGLMITHATATVLSEGSAEERQIVSQLVQAETDELHVMRAELAHRMAALGGFADDPHVQARDKRQRHIFALETAALRMKAETGALLTTTADYERHKDSNAPSTSSFYRVFPDGFDEAKREAGLYRGPVPKAMNSRGTGAPSASEKLSWEDTIIILARCVEDREGRFPTFEAWDAVRAQYHPNAPRAKSIKKGRPWAEVDREVYEYILRANPEAFPRTRAYLNLRSAADRRSGGGRS